MSANVTCSPDQLLVLARAGNSAALGQLLELFRSYLTLLARVQIGRRLQGKFDAADVVQETFLQAHRHIAQFRGAGEREFVGWLQQILASRLAKLMRHYWGTRRRDVRLERQLADALDESSRWLDQGLFTAQSSPSQRAARHEQALLLADTLERLPEDYREVLILHHLNAMTFPEVARQMGRSLDSVKKLWVRALARLRQTLGDAP